MKKRVSTLIVLACVSSHADLAITDPGFSGSLTALGKKTFTQADSANFNKWVFENDSRDWAVVTSGGNPGGYLDGAFPGNNYRRTAYQAITDSRATTGLMDFTFDLNLFDGNNADGPLTVSIWGVKTLSGASFSLSTRAQAGVTVGDATILATQSYTGTSGWQTKTISNIDLGTGYDLVILGFYSATYNQSSPELDVVGIDNVAMVLADGPSEVAVPSNLTATAGNGFVSLDWDDNTEGALASYSVYRSTSSGSYGSALTNGLTTSDYVDNTASNYTTYYYVVSAVDTNSVETDPGNEVLAMPVDPGNQPPAFSSDPVVETNAVEWAVYSATIADNASDPESDSMTFSKVDGPDWLNVASDGGLTGTPAATNTGLNSFTVQVSAAGGSDTATLKITVDVDTTSPTAPANLTATAGDGSVTLDWADNAEIDVAGYNVYRSTNSGSYGSALTNGLAGSGYVDGTVVNETTYYYVVTAVDLNTNESLQSGEVSATPAAFIADYTFTDSSAASVDTDALSIASDLSDIDGIGSGSNGLHAVFASSSLKWLIGDMNDGTVLDDDYLTFTVTPESGMQFDLTTFSFDYVFPGGAGSTIYLFSSQDGFASIDDAIAVFNEADEDNWNTYSTSLAAMTEAAEAVEFRLYFNTTATFTTAQVLADNIRLTGTLLVAPPPAPTGLAATAGNGFVSLDWDDGTESNLAYSVYRSTNSGSYGTALTNGLTSSDYVDNTASNYTTYYYVVTAVDTNDAESGASGEVSATPADPSNQAPAFSSDPVVETNAMERAAYSATLANDASDPESDPMTFSKMDGPAWLSVASDGSLTGIPAATNTGLNSFTVQVSAAGGSDTATLQITVDPDTLPPAAPTGLTAADGNSLVRLSWAGNTEDDLDSYSVYRSTTSNSYTTALVTNLTSSSYIDRAAANGTTYYYAVTASDGNGNESAKSSNASATPDASILEPIVWLDASQGLNLDSGQVAVWTNLASPGTYDAVQADANRRPVPLYEEPQLPGLPVVYFDGGDLLTLDGTVSNSLFSGELTVFIVGRRREGGPTSGVQGILGNYQVSASLQQGWTITPLSNGEYGYRMGNGTENRVEFGNNAIGKFAIVNTRYSDTGGDTGRMELFNSLTEGTGAQNTSPFQVSPSTVDIGIGGYCNYSSLNFDRFLVCDVAEIRMYERALSDSERQSVWDELSAKYEIAQKKVFDVQNVQPTGYDVPADTTIEITFDEAMNPDTITNVVVGAGGLDGYPEGGSWQSVSGQWVSSVSNTVFTFTPDQPFQAGALVMCEITTNVFSARGAQYDGARNQSVRSFVVDTGISYPVQKSRIDTMAIVQNEYVDDGTGQTNVVDHHLPIYLTVPQTDDPCPVMLWVHGGSFNGGGTGTLTNSVVSPAPMDDYFAEKLGIAVVSVSWRSTLSEGTFTKAVSDVRLAVQWVMDHKGEYNIDTSRMGLYGGSAGTPMSSLVSQTDTNITCYIGFNGSYNFLTGYNGGGFETFDPSGEANSAIFNIRTNHPPATLLMHGSADTLISPGQSTEYAAAIAAVGGEAEALIYRDNGHGFYNEGKPMNYPTMVASSKFMSRVFGLGVYLGGYSQWAAGYGIGAGTNDYDSDGINNLTEYGLDGNPTNGQNRGTLPTFIKIGNSFRYVHPKRSDDVSLTYTVETTTNLVSGTWTNQRYIVAGTNVTGDTLNFVTNDIDTIENEKFIRLKIEQ